MHTTMVPEQFKPLNQAGVEYPRTRRQRRHLQHWKRFEYHFITLYLYLLGTLIRSSITAQQAKLDLELVPKEIRLEIGKCKGRLSLGKIQREPTFQVVLDALALTPCYFAFLITADVPEVYMHQFRDSVYKHDTFYRFKMDKKNRFKLTIEIFRDIFKICPRVQGQDFDALPTNEEIVSFLRELGHSREINSLNDVIVDQMHQPWRTFVALINRSLFGKTTGLDKLRLSRAQILWGMYHQKNVEFVSAKEATQIYGAILPESLTSPEIKETKAYKTYLGFATGATPPKIARKFKKASPSKKDLNLNLVLVDKEPKSAKKKVPAKKTTRKHTSEVVIRDTPMESSSKMKEKVDVASGKGIELISGVALTEEAQYEEVRKKRATPPKIARKFKKASPSKKDLNLNLVLVDKEPKSAKKKVPAKKTTRKHTSEVVIKDTPMKSSSKMKEKVDVASGKGIELISEVELTKEAQYEEVCKRSLRDFHKTHLSGSGIVTKTAPSAAKIKPSVTNEGTCVKPAVPYVTEEVSTESELESWEKDEDDCNNKQDSRSEGSDQERDSNDDNTQSDSEKGSDSEHETDENESDKAKGDEDEEIDYTTSQLYDDVDIRLNKPVTTDEGFNQKEGDDAKMTNIQQGNENPEIMLNQVVEDAYVTLSTVPQKTEVPVTSSSHSSDLAFKFLNFSNIPHTDAEIVSPIYVHVHHEVPSKQTPTLLTVPVSIITESLPIYFTIIPQSIPSFTPLPPQSTPTPPPTTEATNPPSTLIDFASVF
ncbi:hypothetical protein Tco_0268405 [Tanacetum coccineum]